MLNACSMSEASTLRLTVEPRLEAVAKFTARMRGFLLQGGHPSEDIDCWELVAAEALNNIIVHGLADRSFGRIEAQMQLTDRATQLQITDDGHSIPTEILANATLKPPADELGSLAEGGWGLGLIKACVDDCRYESKGGLNTLTMVRRRAPEP